MAKITPNADGTDADGTEITEISEVADDGDVAPLDPATIDWSSRPVPAGGGVTKVSIELNVTSFKVNTQAGEFLEAVFAIILEWTDPRIVAAGLDTSDPKTMPAGIWQPAFCFPSGFAFTKHGPFSPEAGPKYVGLTPGRLMLWCTTEPTQVDMSSGGGGEERFRSFPFDSARLDFLFCMSDEARLESDVDVDLNFDRRLPASQGGELQQVTWNAQRRQGEFVCTAMTFGIFKHVSPNTGLGFVDCIWSLHVSRDPTYYIFKGAVPIYVIIGFGLFQYAMDVDKQLNDRLNFLVSLMLSSFAIQWTVTDRLPRTPFVTALDRLIFASLLALFMMALGSVVTSKAVCGELGGCADVDPDEVRLWDMVCLATTLVVFLVMHLDILRRVRAFTAHHGSHRTWKEGGGRANAMTDAQPGRVWRCDLQHDDPRKKIAARAAAKDKKGGGGGGGGSGRKKLERKGSVAYGGFKGEGTIHPVAVDKA
jgi:hypothetical protein